MEVVIFSLRHLFHLIDVHQASNPPQTSWRTDIMDAMMIVLCDAIKNSSQASSIGPRRAARQ
ncbi:hypothetical protein [Frankia sp. AiPa1]|uniref:hypothetical protein n=1 Tax=Frankia sp. AiPa1 TaxID=573492 RepID=UPI00202B9B54|nr:hypothetical protein [Frankia sp. AiPa1]MCL9760526.1 hypothetical protein [Frankia sp. AiPa1]